MFLGFLLPENATGKLISWFSSVGFHPVVVANTSKVLPHSVTSFEVVKASVVESQPD